MPNGMKWGDHHRSWLQELCRTFILQSSDHVHQEIDRGPGWSGIQRLL